MFFESISGFFISPCALEIEASPQFVYEGNERLPFVGLIRHYNTALEESQSSQMHLETAAAHQRRLSDAVQRLNEIGRRQFVANYMPGSFNLEYIWSSGNLFLDAPFPTDTVRRRGLSGRCSIQASIGVDESVGFELNGSKSIVSMSVHFRLGLHGSAIIDRITLQSGGRVHYSGE